MRGRRSRARQDYLGHPTSGAERFLTTNTTLFWFGAPAQPASARCAGCEAGTFYAVIRPPVPGLTICRKYAYPGASRDSTRLSPALPSLLLRYHQHT